LSYEKRVEEKIWEAGLSAYINNVGKYYCNSIHSRRLIGMVCGKDWWPMQILCSLRTAARRPTTLP
jgi:hypothetical protein